MDENGRGGKIILYNPTSIFYLTFLLLLTIFLFPYIILAGNLVGCALAVPSPIILTLFLVSLLGSQINIKLKEKEYVQPMVTAREIVFFGIRWCIPSFEYGVRKTVIAMNVGGALIPLLLSFYLLLFSIPNLERCMAVAYLKVLAVFIIEVLVVHAFAKPVRGLGIAVPSFIPPLTAALTSAALFPVYVKTNPFIIAYIGGTLGTLIGADLLNLNKISKLAAPVVSIGGAGIFDGVYMTGIVAIFLLWLIV